MCTSDDDLEKRNQENIKRLITHISDTLGLSALKDIDEIAKNDTLLVGRPLLNKIKENYPTHKFSKKLQLSELWAIAKSTCIRNCEKSLEDLYNSLLNEDSNILINNALVDDNKDPGKDNNKNSQENKIPFLRCRMVPGSLTSEQRRSNSSQKNAGVLDLMFD